ncbi:MAG: hypothetical protein BWY09_01407 [Candidatus Hydrogenedentes bacterium ADurb.Bin179]|nr:MAG: hypothetical protein BWY09_01407 [Candidatus Hydrogenedentes bacterium ADurb.Bin179]
MFGAVVPVGDFLGKPFLDGGAGFGNPVQPPVTHFFDVAGHDLGDGIALGFLFQGAGNPGAFGLGQQVLDARFFFFEGAIIQVGGIVQVPRVCLGVHFNIQHAPGNGAPVAGRQHAGILNGMFEEEQDPRLRAGVPCVHKYRAALQEVAVAFQGQVQHGIQQGVSGTDEGGHGLALGRDKVFFKGDAFVAGENGFAHADLAVPVAHRRGDMGNLVAARFPLPRGAAQAAEGFEEEGLDIVGLEAAGFGPFHLLAHPEDAARIHGIPGEGAIFEQFLQARPVHAVFDGLFQAGPHFGLVAVADGRDEQVAQRLAFKLEFAEHIEDLAAEGGPGLLQFVQEAAVDIAFAGFIGDQVPQVADLGLADAVDAAEALFDAVRVPGQVIIHHEMGALQVDAFARGVRGQQHLYLGIVQEAFLGLAPLFAADAAVDDDDGLGSSK